MKFYPESKVEVDGFTASKYDFLMNLITLGLYPKFIKKVIEEINIQPTDKIMDFGSGTGRNACLMVNYLSNNGKIHGLDISDIMIKQFENRCKQYSNVTVENKRIDMPLPYRNEYDKVFISFVFHGFPQEIRLKILNNAFNVLKKNGQFAILDFAEFDLKKMPFYLRIPFQIIECPYAFEFIKYDWKTIFNSNGFTPIKEIFFFNKYVRLLVVEKT